MFQLQLAIPEPCHEDWDKMTTNEQGKFCNSCAKTVIDFSVMTDAQLISYFQQLKEEHICGSVAADQLQRKISTQPLPRKKIFNYWQYVFAFFIMLGKSQQTRAQGGLKVKLEKTDQSPVIVKDAVSPETIHFSIKDNEGLPVNEVNIYFLSGRAAVISRYGNGNFSIDKKYAGEDLVISGIGFQDTTISVKNIDAGLIRLNRDIKQLNEVVVTSGGHTLGGLRMMYSTSSVTIRDTIKNLISTAINIYPNPVIRGNQLTLSLKLKERGTYRVHFIDASGRLLLTQNYTTADKKPVRQITIPASWSYGIYFVVITTTDGKQLGKQKIIVM